MKHISFVNKVLYNPTIYNLYFFIGNFVLSCLKLFIRPNDKLILFVSFGGRRFDDSPKAIYDLMIQDARYKDYQFVWAFIMPEKYDVCRKKKKKIDTLKYFITALRARLWITNSSITRGLSFKGKHTFYYNSWHGTALKKMGIDIHQGNEAFSIKKKKNKDNYTDLMSAQGQYDIDIFSRVFNIPPQNFVITGLPRNDELVKSGEKVKEKIKKYYNIPGEKKIILYAPTFREYSRDNNDNCYIAPPINIQKWEGEIGGNYVMLFRAHYEVVNVLNITNTSFVKDVSDYPILNDLMLASDLLITDYSSICFDYSIQAKPIICFAYDYDVYNSHRGLYFDLREVLDNKMIKTEDDLLNYIKKLDFEKGIALTKKFRERYVTEYGNASRKVLDLLINKIQ